MSKIMLKPSRYNISFSQEDNLYIANSLTKAIVMFPNTYRARLRSIFEGCELSGDGLVNILYDNRLVVNKEVDEFRTAVDAVRKFRNNERDMYLSVFTTEECNFRCSYCYQAFREKLMTKEVEHDLISFIGNKIRKEGIETIYLNWFGGEPLLGINSIESIEKSLKNQYPKTFINSHVTTNGYLLNDRITKKLISELGIKRFQITIDGNSARHNISRPLKDGSPTFGTIFNNICQMVNTHQDVKITLRINFDLTWSPSDLDFLTLLPSDAREKFNISLCPIHNNPDGKFGYTEENEGKISLKLFDLREQVKYFGFETDKWFMRLLPVCEALHKNYYSLLPNGTFIKCTGLRPSDDKVIGTLRGGHECFSNTKSRLLWSTEDMFLEGKCDTCSLFPLCQGGGCGYGAIEKQLKGLCIPEKFYTKKHLGLLI